LFIRRYRSGHEVGIVQKIIDHGFTALTVSNRSHDATQMSMSVLRNNVRLGDGLTNAGPVRWMHCRLR